MPVELQARGYDETGEGEVVAAHLIHRVLTLEVLSQLFEKRVPYLDDAEQRDDRGLVGGDRIEITH